MDKTSELAGLRVLVTRPSQQAHSLCQKISHAGGEPLLFPTLEIAALPMDDDAFLITKHLDAYNIALFISANAVTYGLPWLTPLPDTLTLACVGPQTAATLSKAGYTADLIPTHDFSSDGLLQLPAFQQVQNKRILIVRGQGGRETLKDTLQKRGAEVTYLTCYQRALAQTDPQSLTQALQEHTLDIITASSQHSLSNLAQLCPSPLRPLLRQLPLVTVSKRMRDQALKLGFSRPDIFAENASDPAILKALLTYVSEDHQS